MPESIRSQRTDWNSQDVSVIPEHRTRCISISPRSFLLALIYCNFSGRPLIIGNLPLVLGYGEIRENSAKQ